MRFLGNWHNTLPLITVVAYSTLCLPAALLGSIICRIRSARFRSSLAVAVITLVLFASTMCFWPIFLFGYPLALLLAKDICDRSWLKATVMVVIQSVVFLAIRGMVELILIDQGLMHW
jgi:hypothetical protein